jgi:hypothetical protein
MFKAGANFKDKNRIRKMLQQGWPQDRIVQVTRILPEHVAAIALQVEKGTLHVTRGESRVGDGSYGEGDGDGNEEDV